MQNSSDNSKSANDRENESAGLRRKKMGRYFLLGTLAITAVFFLNMIKIFILPVFLAVVVTGLFHPLYRGILKRTGNRRTISAFLCCLFIILGFLIPVYIIGDLVAREAMEIYESAEADVRRFINAFESGESQWLNTLRESRIVTIFGLDQVDWQATIEDILKNSASMLGSVINIATRETFMLFIHIFILLFAMYYFFKDGESIIQRVKYLIPLDEHYEDEIMRKFAEMSRATVKGVLVIAIIKGVLGGLTFWIFGVTGPILWGVVMIILSIIPLVGVWLVMVPAGIVMIIMGDVWQGITVILIGVVFIGNIDNVLNPILVGRDTGMHELLIFLSTIGGLSVFGIMGFLVGPMIASMLVTLLHVYGIEFREQLEGSSDTSIDAVNTSSTISRK
jgi:predicted PurR-regulated permease PerM